MAAEGGKMCQTLYVSHWLDDVATSDVSKSVPSNYALGENITLAKPIAFISMT